MDYVYLMYAIGDVSPDWEGHDAADGIMPLGIFEDVPCALKELEEHLEYVTLFGEMKFTSGIEEVRVRAMRKGELTFTEYALTERENKRHDTLLWEEQNGFMSPLPVPTDGPRQA